MTIRICEMMQAFARLLEMVEARARRLEGLMEMRPGADGGSLVWTAKDASSGDATERWVSMAKRFLYFRESREAALSRPTAGTRAGVLGWDRAFDFVRTRMISRAYKTEISTEFGGTSGLSQSAKFQPGTLEVHAVGAHNGLSPQLAASFKRLSSQCASSVCSEPSSTMLGPIPPLTGSSWECPPGSGIWAPPLGAEGSGRVSPEQANLIGSIARCCSASFYSSRRNMVPFPRSTPLNITFEADATEHSASLESVVTAQHGLEALVAQLENAAKNCSTAAIAATAAAAASLRCQNRNGRVGVDDSAVGSPGPAGPVRENDDFDNPDEASSAAKASIAAAEAAAAATELALDQAHFLARRAARLTSDFRRREGNQAV